MKKFMIRSVLNTAVNSSLWAKVSITGAFDDACACYFGGIILSDNYYKKLIKREPINNESMGSYISYHMVFQRGNVIKLKIT